MKAKELLDKHSNKTVLVDLIQTVSISVCFVMIFDDYICIKCIQLVYMLSCLGADEDCAQAEQEQSRFPGHVVCSLAAVREGAFCLPSTQGTAHNKNHTTIV